MMIFLLALRAANTMAVQKAPGIQPREQKSTFILKTTLEQASLGLAIRTENAQEITDIESFARFSGKLVPIAPQSAQWAIVSQYNESNPDNQIDLKASETFNVADAYIWVLEG
jgi:hypothetical protein